jgi:DNA polymerase III delta prime subunit
MAEQTSCWRDVEDALGAGLKRLLLYGPSGTGKTFAALTKVEPTMSRRLVCTEDLTSGDMLGTWMPNGPDRWGFHEGPAIQAWRGVGGEGGRLVVDEVDDEWLEDSATMFAYARSRDVFPDRFRLERSCIDKSAEKAMFDMASFGRGQLDVEPTWEESL